jgi:putative photosynthetic complex assembly protein
VTNAATNSTFFGPLPLAFAIAIVCGALAISVGARLSGVGTTHLDYTRPEITRDLLFKDRPDGSIIIEDATSQRQIGEVVPGNDGFVRAVMRILAHDRLVAGGDKNTPFTLTRWDNGRLTISDPQTGKKTELVGFGASNEAAFAKLLPNRSERQ